MNSHPHASLTASAPSSDTSVRPNAVLVGRPGDVPGFDAAQYRSILWLVDAVGALQQVRDRREGEMTTVVLDHLAPGAVVPLLDRFQRRDPFRIPHLLVSDLVGSEPGGSDADTLAQMRAWFSRLESNLGRVRQDGFSRQKNFLLNVTTYAQRRLPAVWAGALRGLPAFVCGTGSSLEISVSALALVADRGIVIAADSALPTLARHGVRADFAIAIDSLKSPAECLQPGMDPARVVLAASSSPGWREAMAAERVWFLSHAHPTEDWLAGMGVAAAPVVAAENCGITALELAYFLGCAPIHLFGLDLAVEDSPPVLPEDDDDDPLIGGTSRPKVASLARVPGNDSLDVPTLHHSDWTACEARLAVWPPGLVVNVNDRGARLRNTRLVHPRQFVFSGSGAKRPVLARLPVPVIDDAEPARHALASVGAQGALGCRVVADLRALLERSGQMAVATELRRMLDHTDLARALGSFTEKVLTHETVPGSDDVAFWNEAIDEFEELCCLAEAVYGAPVT